MECGAIFVRESGQVCGAWSEAGRIGGAGRARESAVCLSWRCSARGWMDLFAAFDAALRLLHPFMPFLTEELWHQLPQKAGAKSIALGQFPEVLAHWKNKDAVCEADAIQEVVTTLRNIRAELKLDPK